MTDEQISQFMELTGSDHDIAEQYIARNHGKVQEAVNDYFQDDAGRTPTPTSDSHPSKDTSKFRTMAEMISGDDASEDDETNLFTGGEKSGLQVENPDNKAKKRTPMNLVEDLLKKAREEANQPDNREPIEEPEEPKFTGTGYKLGSDEQNVTSTKIADPEEDLRHHIPGKVTRTITFWKEGFQVEDGRLYRYDDPENAEYLKQLNQGRAPLSLLNVEMFQDVDVHVIKKLEESYVPPKRAAGGFHGSGHRLGSPVPGEPILVGGEPEPVKKEETKPEPAKAADSDEVKQGARIQIRLASGGRLVHSFAPTDNVSAIYDYVTANTTDTREWRLALAFPLQFLDDKKDETISDAGLANSTVVQRWK